MNTLFAFVLFMIVFMIGIESIAPRICHVEPDSPADKAGLLPGDLIKEIDGQRILEFNEVNYAVLLSHPNEPIDFLVEREDGLHHIPVVPERQAFQGSREAPRLMVGIGYGRTPKIVLVGSEIDTSQPNMPRENDVIVEVDGIAVNDDNASAIYELIPYAREVYVDRPNPDTPGAPPQRVKVGIPPNLGVYPADSLDIDTVSVLGLAPLSRFATIDPKGRAAMARLEAGDTVLSWDDIRFPTWAQIARAEKDFPERDIAFTVRKANGAIVSGFVRPKRPQARRRNDTGDHPARRRRQTTRGRRPCGLSNGAPARASRRGGHRHRRSDPKPARRDESVSIGGRAVDT